jgi:UDP:flavonoid glycosyltransferase YjiC (YdhE family)
VTPRRFLWVTWEGGGTTPPELAVVRRLSARGHAVRVLGDACLEADARAVGADFSSFQRAPQRRTRTRESEITADWAARTPLGAFARARDRHAFAPAGLFARDVLDVLAAWPADCVVVDAMLFGGLAGAERSGLPFAAVIPMTSFLPAAGQPPPGLGLWPARRHLGAARDRLLLALGDRLLWRSCLPLLNRARASVGLAGLGHPLDQIRAAAKVLVLTDPHFDFDAAPEAGGVVYTGPELDDPVWAAPATEPLRWPEGKSRPLVVVGLSSSYQAQEPLLERVIAALGELPVRGLVTLGPALSAEMLGGAGDIPGNVLVRQSVRHSEVLKDAALVITHGGHGTVIRALAAGVPLLVLPMGRDQADNAARVEWLGAGRRLSAGSGVGRIAGAITAALGDGALREGARAAAKELRRWEGRDVAVSALEALAEGRK